MQMKKVSFHQDNAPCYKWMRSILRAKTHHSTEKALKSQRSVGMNALRLKETMLMNKIEFLEKTVFFLVIPETIE